MLEVVLLAAGFVLLVKGADFFVDGSVGIAKTLKIPSVIIGLTVVALGTSAPEAVVSLTASLKGANALAVGNVVGSNIFNLLLVVGLCGLIKPFGVNFKEMSGDFGVSIGSAAALFAIILVCGDSVPRVFGFTFLAVFALYMFMLIRKARQPEAAEHAVPETSETTEKPLGFSIFWAIFGCALIIFGGQLTVDNAVKIASAIGMSERVIGLTVCAVGTSLPELVTSLTACRKGETGIALGNIIGSNIFNILAVLGIAGAVAPLSVDPKLLIDLSVLIFGSFCVYLFIKGGKITRLNGAAMVFLFAAYTAFILINV